MSQKSKKQFGVWMDSHHATVVGKPDAQAENFSVHWLCRKCRRWF
jgi:hypothetical protein